VSESQLLLTPEALRLINQLDPAELQNELSLITKLRKAGHDPALVQVAITQLKLRERAKNKFGEFANSMLFTSSGLEQATRLDVAAHHAGRFRQNGIKSITDMGCGIGADSLAFASLGLDVVAIEKDPETAALASFNLASFPNAQVIVADAETHTPDAEAVWFDPARRQLDSKALNRTLLAPSDFSPNLDHVFEMATKKPLAVKLGPAFPKELIPESANAQWVSHRGDLVELTLWFGFDGKKYAALQLGAKAYEFQADEIELAESGPLEDFIYEPDSSLIRSGLMGNLANQFGLKTVSPGIAYLTSESEIDSPWLKKYRVHEVLPLDVKQISKALAQRGVGRVEIKKRGVDITPEELRPKLKLKGSSAATLILTKVGGARKALICN
jgi:hypothetical protein